MMFKKMFPWLLCVTALALMGTVNGVSAETTGEPPTDRINNGILVDRGMVCYPPHNLAMTSSTVKINNVEVYRINPTPPPTQPVSPDPQTATTMHELDLVARAREQVLRATNSPRQQIVNDYLTTFRSRPDLVDSVYVDAHGTIQCREVNHAGFEEIYLNDNQANMVTDVQRLLDEYRFWKGILERGCMIVIYDDESPLLVAEGNIEATWQELQRAYDNGPNSEDWEFITPAEAKAVANYPRLPDLED